MTRPSIVRQFPDAAADATFMTYGPMSLESSGGDSGGVEIVETFGEYEAEYAAIRRGVGVVETPQRGVVVVGGADRLSFLQSMLTNDVGTLVAGQGRRAFLLGKTGRIIADVLALERGDRTLLVVDRLDAPKLIAELDKYVITEDVQLSDVSEKWVVIGLHGPGGVGLVEEMSHAKPQALTGAWEKLEQRVVTLAGRETIVVRHDEAGVLGLHVMIEASGAGVLYGELLERAKASGWNSAPLPLGEGGEKRSAEPGEGSREVARSTTPQPPSPDSSLRSSSPSPGRGEDAAGRGSGSHVRPTGWLAFNTARIEAGSPLFHIDFGPDSLPAETGLLEQAVSFTKGCYLGQEIVARMKHLGHPKRVLVGLKMEDDAMPIAGSQVFEAPPPPEVSQGGGSAVMSGAIVGGVTSSTVSPLLGNTAIAMAVIKWGKHKVDTKLLVPAEGKLRPASVHELRFIPGESGEKKP